MIRKKKSKVKLNTFHTQSEILKKLKEKAKASGISNEISALFRITQIHAGGGQMDFKDFIGKHECSDFPPSLFEEDGKMRSGKKSKPFESLKRRNNGGNYPSTPRR